MSNYKNPLEVWVAGMLNRIDKWARISKASGASTENYDIQTSIPLAIECKIQGTKKNPVVSLITWDKLLREMPIKSKRTPMLFIQNSHGEKFVVLNAEDFFNDFLYEMYEEEK